MNDKVGLAQHCVDNVLYIPFALFGMRDVKPVLFNGDSSIFFKDLEKDLVNVEFHTQVPCLVYIESGKEVITTCNNESFTVESGEAILLPEGLVLHSDYFHTGDGLKAHLLFFGTEVLSEFLSGEEKTTAKISNEDAIFKLKTNSIVSEYFNSLTSVYKSIKNSPKLLDLKLLELLYLIDLSGDNRLKQSLCAIQQGKHARRNIKRLMDQYGVSELSAKELASLSGRSLSSFNREFKSIYGTTPKQWLIDRRMGHAYSLLTETGISVTGAATATGYANVSHFISAFKKKYGVTPRQLKTGQKTVLLTISG